MTETVFARRGQPRWVLRSMIALMLTATACQVQGESSIDEDLDRALAATSVTSSSGSGGLRPLSSEPVPQPAGGHILDQPAAVRLGKALFWDVQTGGDGQTACASCHFLGGADDRRINTLNPGPDRLFASGGVTGPGQTFTPGNLTSDDRVGSQGVAAAV